MQHNATSPFLKTEFVTLEPGDEYTKRGSHLAFIWPDGTIRVNFSDATPYSFLAPIARQIGAKIGTIQGTWTFVPDTKPVEGDEDVYVSKEK